MITNAFPISAQKSIRRTGAIAFVRIVSTVVIVIANGPIDDAASVVAHETPAQRRRAILLVRPIAAVGIAVADVRIAYALAVATTPKFQIRAAIHRMRGRGTRRTALFVRLVVAVEFPVAHPTSLDALLFVFALEFAV